MRIHRPVISANLLCAAVVIYVFLISNLTFFEKTFLYFGDGRSLYGALFALSILCALIAFSVSLFSFRYVLKPVAMFVILAGTVSAYFVDTYGIIIDKNMVGSVLATTPQEAGELVTSDLISWLVLTALAPCLLIAWASIEYSAGWIGLRSKGAIILGCLILSGAIAISNYSAFSSTIRNHKDLLKSLNPVKPISSTVSYAMRRARNVKQTVKAIGTDAHRVELSRFGAKHRLAIIVAGETARAKSFSMNGYSRETDGGLKRRDVLNFTNASSCGTHTGVSLPCMFSVYGRSEFRETKARYTENLLDVLQRAGVEVKWWDNNTSSAKVANRIPFESVYYISEPPYCSDEGCFDEILVARLKTHLASLNRDAVLVIHPIGSHGPAYFRRVPPEFKKFQPACETSKLSACTREEIINAYDNTIVYTDHVLSKVIDLLRSVSDRFDGAMIYMSDHGESTGELGLYLHGLPYLIAPTEQTWVPFTTWLSEGISTSAGIDMACMRARQDDSVSHDNLFHSVLGLMGVGTHVYDKSLDVFGRCRTKEGASISAAQAGYSKAKRLALP